MTANRGPLQSRALGTLAAFDTARVSSSLFGGAPQRPRSTSCTTPLNGTDCRSSKYF